VGPNHRARRWTEGTALRSLGQMTFFHGSRTQTVGGLSPIQAVRWSPITVLFHAPRVLARESVCVRPSRSGDGNAGRPWKPGTGNRRRCLRAARFHDRQPSRRQAPDREASRAVSPYGTRPSSSQPDRQCADDRGHAAQRRDHPDAAVQRATAEVPSSTSSPMTTP